MEHLELYRGEIPEGSVQAPGVVPVDPAGGRELDVCERPERPGSAARSGDILTCPTVWFPLLVASFRWWSVPAGCRRGRSRRVSRTQGRSAVDDGCRTPRGTRRSRSRARSRHPGPRPRSARDHGSAPPCLGPPDGAVRDVRLQAFPDGWFPGGIHRSSTSRSRRRAERPLHVTNTPSCTRCTIRTWLP